MNNSKNNDGPPNDSKYIPELMAEKDSIDSSFVHAARLLNEEIEKIKNPEKTKTIKFRDVMKDEVIKMEEDIIVPVHDYPKVNFVGRLIGPGGTTMKGIQEISNTKIGVLGKGSIRAKPGEELDMNNPKYAQAKLDMPLHVHISAMGTLPNVYYNMSVAITEIQKVLQMDPETATQFAIAQGMAINPNRGRPQNESRPEVLRPQRGGLPQRGGYGGRGARGASIGNGRGRGAMSSQVSRGGARGARGMGSRGAGMRGSGRGARGTPNRRGAPVAKPALDQYGAGGDFGYDSYGQDFQEGFGDSAYDQSFDETTAYEDNQYGMLDSSLDYGYDHDMGYAGGVKPSFAQKSFRGKAPRGGRGGRPMSKPY